MARADKSPAAGNPLPREVSGLDRPLTYIGRWHIEREIGRGGMAVVYLARDMDGREVVLKRIKAEKSRDKRAEEMFLREGRICENLNHPNIVRIFEQGKDEQGYFIAMELLEGLTLHDLAFRFWYAGRALPIEPIVRAGCDVARGLHYAHNARDNRGGFKGLVHRDVSPDNIFLARGGLTKVLDFGIAKPLGGESLTQTGELKGKVNYLAPELLVQEIEPDARCDLWALGVTLYLLLTGKRPFARKGDVQTMQAIVHEAPRRMRDVNPNIPLALEETIKRLLAKDPEKRFQSGAEVAIALGELLESLPPGERSPVWLLDEAEGLRDRRGSKDKLRPPVASETTVSWPDGTGGETERRAPSPDDETAQLQGTPLYSEQETAVLAPAGGGEPLTRVERASAAGRRMESHTLIVDQQHSQAETAVRPVAPRGVTMVTLDPRLSHVEAPFDDFDKPMDHTTGTLNRDFMVDSNSELLVDRSGTVKAPLSPDTHSDGPPVVDTVVGDTFWDSVPSNTATEPERSPASQAADISIPGPPEEEEGAARGVLLGLAGGIVGVFVLFAAFAFVSGSDAQSVDPVTSPPLASGTAVHDPQPDEAPDAPSSDGTVPGDDVEAHDPPPGGEMKPGGGTQPVTEPALEDGETGDLDAAPEPPGVGEDREAGDAPSVRRAAPGKRKTRSVAARAPGRVQWLTPRGKRLGKGNTTLKVSPSITHVVAHDPTWGSRTTLAVKSGAVDFGALKAGSLVVRARPWANVRVGGRDLGLTPLKPVSLPPGNYKVTLTWEAVTRTVPVQIKSGKSNVVQMDMRKN